MLGSSVHFIKNKNTTTFGRRNIYNSYSSGIIRDEIIRTNVYDWYRAHENIYFFPRWK